MVFSLAVEREVEMTPQIDGVKSPNFA